VEYYSTIQVRSYVLKHLLCRIALAVLLIAPSAVAGAEGTIDATYKYAWGDQMGWINFAPSESTITVSDDTVTGYAWSDGFGWINFAPSTGGVSNNGAGELSGYAWSQHGGWINFSGVDIDTSTGRFSGTAMSDAAGTISFDCSECDVRTTWRPSEVSGGSGGGGGGGGGSGSSRRRSSGRPIERVATTTPVMVATNTPAHSVSASQLLFTRDLTVGSVGSDVRRLQEFLNHQGFIVAVFGPGSLGSETEIFGQRTRQALVSFQESEGIVPAVGYFGPLTRAVVHRRMGVSALIPEPVQAQTLSRNLMLGMSGDDVRMLQEKLIALNVGQAVRELQLTGATGYFGSRTQAALIEYQISKNISPALGYCGPITRSSLGL
jgi:peptidoglycan hydrolase-like protein with peptidoglycan-binding domain